MPALDRALDEFARAVWILIANYNASTAPIGISS
jgi:hypothetical protein